jgi:hypothetical protein
LVNSASQKEPSSLNAEVEYRLSMQREAEREAEEEAADKGRKK